MPLKLLNFKFGGKSYGQFTKIVHDKLKLCTYLFKLNFRRRVVVVVLCTVNESVVGFPKLFILMF